MFVAWLAIVSVLCASAQTRSDLIRKKLLERDTSSVLVASHRGDWRNFCENSLEAIDNAVKMGVDIVEVDVQRTKDGQLILMHDAKLDRTTTGKGYIKDTTLAYIRTLHLKNGCNIKTIHRVPTLEEALVHAKGKVMLNLDKADRYFDQIYALMEKTGTTKQIIMKGKKSAEEVRRQYGRYLQDVIYMPVVDLDKTDAVEEIDRFVTGLHPVAFELLYKSDSNPIPPTLPKRMGGKALIWYNALWDTLAGGHDDDMALENPDRGYGYLIDTLGAHIIQTDRPQYLIGYLRSRKLHD